MSDDFFIIRLEWRVFQRRTIKCHFHDIMKDFAKEKNCLVTPVADSKADITQNHLSRYKDHGNVVLQSGRETGLHSEYSPDKWDLKPWSRVEV